MSNCWLCNQLIRLCFSSKFMYLIFSGELSLHSLVLFYSLPSFDHAFPCSWFSLILVLSSGIIYFNVLIYHLVKLNSRYCKLCPDFFSLASVQLYFPKTFFSILTAVAHQTHQSLLVFDTHCSKTAWGDEALRRTIGSRWLGFLRASTFLIC